MKFASLVERTGIMPWFSLPLLAQAFDDPREAIRVQLSRWMSQGKVDGLRRGMYTLASPYRRAPLVPPKLANDLYHPSYLSSTWALALYDLIPEAAVWLTSATSRGPRRFENRIGTFLYQHLKAEAFFGYVSLDIGGAQVLVAQPEKALLDHWHLARGEWTTERLSEMRYQHADVINGERLETYAARFGSPRLVRATKRWMMLMQGSTEGTMVL